MQTEISSVLKWQQLLFSSLLIQFDSITVWSSSIMEWVELMYKNGDAISSSVQFSSNSVSVFKSIQCPNSHCPPTKEAKSTNIWLQNVTFDQSRAKLHHEVYCLLYWLCVVLCVNLFPVCCLCRWLTMGPADFQAPRWTSGYPTVWLVTEQICSISLTHKWVPATHAPVCLARLLSHHFPSHQLHSCLFSSLLFVL